MKHGQAIAAAVALTATLWVGCALSADAKRDKYLARGKALVEKKDYVRALLEFRNAARAKPDAEVYYQMGMAYLGMNDVRTGYAALKKAVELNPKHAKAQLRMAQLLSMTQDPELLKDAEKRLQALLNDKAGGVEALNALAFTELRLGNTESAITNYEQTLAQYPGELTASIMLARVKLAAGDVKAAENILKKACAEATKSADARRVLAEFYISQKRLPQAEAELRTALTIDPRSGATLLTLGKLLLAADRKQEAEQVLKQLINIEGYKHLYAVFLLNQGRNAEAIAEFQRVAREDPDDRDARTRLVAAYYRLGRYPEADAVLRQALGRNPKDTDALLQAGEVAMGAGRLGEAEVDFNKVLQLRPNAAEAHYLKARLYDRRGDKRLYRQELNEALRLNPALERIRVELARDLVNQNDGASALAVLDAAPDAQKHSPAITVQRNWALWLKGDLAEMRRGIDELLAAAPSSDAQLQDAAWKLRSGNRQGARAAVQKALDIAPDDVRALQVMAETYSPQEHEQAAQKVREYAATQPKSASVQEFLGLTMLGSRKWPEARAAFDSAKALDSGMTSVEFSLAQLDVLEKNLGSAEKRLEPLLANTATGWTARRWLGVIQVLKGNRQAALEQFRRVADEDPTDAQAANNVAYLLIEDSKQYEEALKYAQRAVERAPTNAAYCDTLGWAYYNKALYASAIPLLERASASRENAIYAYHLAMAYAKAGDMKRGREALAAALKVNPRLPEAKLAENLVGASRP